MERRPGPSDPSAGRILDSFVRLRDGCVLVRGARRGAIYDLVDERLTRIDESVTRALRMAEGGLPVREILRRMGGEGHSARVMEEVISFLRRLPAVEIHPSLPPPPVAVPTIRPSQTLDFIWLELTGVCNLRCIHCYAEAGDAPRADELDRERWIGILEEGAALGCRRVQFTGGEPTIHPGLPSLIRRARDLGYTFIEVFTNATRMTDETIDLFEENGVHVAISLYSHDPAVHDRVTGEKGSWERTTRSVRRLVARGVPVRAAVIVMRINEDGLEETVRYLHSLGLERIGVDTIRPSGRGTDPSLRPTRWANERTSPRFGTGGREEVLSFDSCWSGKIAVESRGRVIPCIFGRDLVAGDLRRQSLHEVITGERMRLFWGWTLDEVEVCKDCEFRFACRDCRAIAQTTHGDIREKNPRCTYDPHSGVWGEGSARQVDDLCLGRQPPGPGKEEDAMARTPGQGPPDPPRPRRRDDVIAREVDGEIVLYDPTTHGIHGLNPTASFIWDLCDGSRTSGEIARELGSVYPEVEGIPADVEETLGKFRSLGILEA